MNCVSCGHELRDGAAFCGDCGERQPLAIETPDAIARYRSVLEKFLAEGALDGAKHAQLETLRVKLGIQLATHAKLTAELAPTIPPPLSIKLAIDVATLKPLDFDTIHESVRKTGRCVIVHEAPRTAGFGAEIAARLAEHAMYDLVAPVERVTGYDTHIPLYRLEMKYLPSVERIVDAAKRTLASS